MTSGGQVVISCGDLRERGAIVEHALCVIDRQAGGPEALAEIGVELRPLFTMTELNGAELRSWSRTARDTPVQVTKQSARATGGCAGGRSRRGAVSPLIAANAVSTQRRAAGERLRQRVAGEEADLRGSRAGGP